MEELKTKVSKLIEESQAYMKKLPKAMLPISVLLDGFIARLTIIKNALEAGELKEELKDAYLDVEKHISELKGAIKGLAKR